MNSFCSECCQLVGPGIRHSCNKKATFQNLCALITSKDIKVADRVVSHVLKEISVVGDSMNIKLATESKGSSHQSVQRQIIC